MLPPYERLETFIVRVPIAQVSPGVWTAGATVVICSTCCDAESVAEKSLLTSKAS